MVRLDVATGSLDEGPATRGYAHFVEHMAFNGSTHVPEGEMVRLLERKGLAFGADTNAQTSFEQTTYMLDLPRNDADLIDTALMLMRETASELTFSPGAVARERGVVLSELRDGQGYALDNFTTSSRSSIPRRPIPSACPSAPWRRSTPPPPGPQGFLAAPLRARQDHAGGDRRCRSGRWKAPSPPALATGRPAPVRPARTRAKSAGPEGPSDVWTNPALAERVTVARHGPWLDEPDTIANRRETCCARSAMALSTAVSRRSRRVDAPFRGAGLAPATCSRSAAPPT
jgi:zinc protease